jgi:DnaJ domain
VVVKIESRSGRPVIGSESLDMRLGRGCAKGVRDYAENVLSAVTPSADVARSYRVLGVDPSASPADVKRAFRTLVRRLHPDANPTSRSGSELSAIVDAYRKLGRAGAIAQASPAPVAPRHIDVYA